MKAVCYVVNCGGQWDTLHCSNCSTQTLCIKSANVHATVAESQKLLNLGYAVFVICMLTNDL